MIPSEFPKIGTDFIDEEKRIRSQKRSRRASEVKLFSYFIHSIVFIKLIYVFISYSFIISHFNSDTS